MTTRTRSGSYTNEKEISMRKTSTKAKLLLLPAVAAAGVLIVTGCSSSSTPAPTPTTPSASASISYNPAAVRVRPVLNAVPAVEANCVEDVTKSDETELTVCSYDKTTLYTLGPVALTGKAVTSLSVSTAMPSTSSSASSSVSGSAALKEDAPVTGEAPVASAPATTTPSGSASASASASAKVEPVTLTAKLDPAGKALWAEETTVLATQTAPKNQVAVLVEGYIVDVLTVTEVNSTGEVTFKVSAPEAVKILTAAVDNQTGTPTATSSATATGAPTATTTPSSN